jgi:hypothetical protein
MRSASQKVMLVRNLPNKERTEGATVLLWIRLRQTLITVDWIEARRYDCVSIVCNKTMATEQQSNERRAPPFVDVANRPSVRRTKGAGRVRPVT